MNVLDVVDEEAAVASGQRPCGVVDCPWPSRWLCRLLAEPALLVPLCGRHTAQALDDKWEQEWELPSGREDIAWVEGEEEAS